jgi:hypothetical protein
MSPRYIEAPTAMAKSSTQRPIRKSDRFSYLNELHLGGIQRRIAAGDYVDGAELAAALREHGARPLPPDVLNYLCRLLEDDVPKPKGRKGWKNAPPADELRYNMVVRGLYKRHLDRLTERTHRYGKPAGWTKLDGSAGKIAARIVAKRYLSGAESWRTVQNIASSRK